MTERKQRSIHIVWKQDLIDLYLDRWNNYLTDELFAEHREITLEHAQQLIAMGKFYYHDGRDIVD